MRKIARTPNFKLIFFNHNPQLLSWHNISISPLCLQFLLSILPRDYNMTQRPNIKLLKKPIETDEICATVPLKVKPLISTRLPEGFAIPRLSLAPEKLQFKTCKVSSKFKQFILTCMDKLHHLKSVPVFDNTASFRHHHLSAGSYPWVAPKSAQKRAKAREFDGFVIH